MARRVRDPGELERQKLARQRFRSLIRSVMYNRIWLNDAEDQQKISLNVKRNVAMLVRRKHKIGVLTMAEKALIRTPHSLRSIEDRKALLKLVTGMTCFSKFPPQIRARLVPVIKFLYLGAGRKIIKEGGFADTIYFILYGEVEASRRIYDPLKNEYTDKVEFIYGAGDCIGDIEMIEDSLRKNTYTATSVVELLVVFGHDFDDVLRLVMTKQWFEKKLAIDTLGYFDYLSQEQLISVNKMSVLLEFDALETIYYEDKGEASFAYFVLSGECMILQCLQLLVKKVLHLKTYELVDLVNLNKKDMFDRFVNKDGKKIGNEGDKSPKRSFNIHQDLDSDEEYNSELNRIKQALRTMDIKTIEISCGTRKLSEEKLEVKEIESSTISSTIYKEHDFPNIDVEGPISRESEDFDGIEDHSSNAMLLATKKENKESTQLEKDATVISKDQTVVELKNETVAEVENATELKKSDELVDSKLETTAENVDAPSPASSSSLSSEVTKKPEPAVMENHFIDVGSLSFGGIFGLGEKIEDRVIMARTKVQCLMVPRFWLFEKEQNPGRIWQRRRFVINTSIPSRKQLFEDFLNTRKWQTFKKQFIASCLDPTSLQNPTQYQDIPIMFHIINPVED